MEKSNSIQDWKFKVLLIFYKAGGPNLNHFFLFFSQAQISRVFVSNPSHIMSQLMGSPSRVSSPLMVQVKSFNQSVNGRSKSSCKFNGKSVSSRESVNGESVSIESQLTAPCPCLVTSQLMLSPCQVVS